MNSTVVRSLSGVVFIGLLLASLLIHPLGFAFFFCTIMLIGMHEFYRMLLPQTNHLLGYITGGALFILIFGNAFGSHYFPPNLFYIIALPICLIFINALYRFRENPFQKIAIQLAGILYVALPFSLFTELAFIDDASNLEFRLILSLFIFLWANDVGAYCIGMLFGRHGRHKLFERISPNKSWEGFWGGLLFAQLAALVISLIWAETLGISTIHWFVLAFIITIAGTYGDLVESMLKRSTGVKDSGKMMPGHGGVLDRFDGALLAFPCTLAYLKLFQII